MTNSSSPISHGELRKIAADLKSGKIVFALGNAYPDYALGKEVAVMVSDLIESAISETLERMPSDAVIAAICKWMAWDYGDKAMRADASKLYYVILNAAPQARVNVGELTATGTSQQPEGKPAVAAFSPDKRCSVCGDQEVFICGRSDCPREGSVDKQETLLDTARRMIKRYNRLIVNLDYSAELYADEAAVAEAFLASATVKAARKCLRYTNVGTLLQTCGGEGDWCLAADVEALEQEVADWIGRYKGMGVLCEQQQQRASKAEEALSARGVTAEAVAYLEHMVGVWDEEQRKRTKSIADTPWHISEARKVLAGKTQYVHCPVEKEKS